MCHQGHITSLTLELLNKSFILLGSSLRNFWNYLQIRSLYSLFLQSFLKAKLPVPVDFGMTLLELNFDKALILSCRELSL